MGVGQIDTLGGMQKMNTINESGLYNVILRSDKPAAPPKNDVQKVFMKGNLLSYFISALRPQTELRPV